MSRMSELDLELSAVRDAMREPDDVGYSVYRLTDATQSLFELSASNSKRHLLAAERNEIEAAYVRLGRLLSQLRAA